MRITDVKKQNGKFLLSIKNAEFEEGKIHGIIGANGSGKTTLAKIIAGIMPFDSGKIDYGLVSPREITLTSQRPYLMHTTVYQNLIYPLKIRDIKIDEDTVDNLLQKVDLLDKKKQYALSLSSGEQQKLSFIRALIFSPKLIIVDETLSNLDPDSADLFETMMLNQQKENPITWITISHQLVHIKRVCDKVHFMENGDIVAADTPKNLLINPTDKSVIKYLSNTEVSFKG